MNNTGSLYSDDWIHSDAHKEYKNLANSNRQENCIDGFWYFDDVKKEYKYIKIV